MANDDAKNKKSQRKHNDTSQQSITLNFVPEVERYKRPKNMEEHIRTYFEGINGLNKRIIAEERKIVAQNRNTWPTLPVEERDKLLNDRLISGEVRQKYNSNEEYWNKRTPWQPEKLSPPVDMPNMHNERTASTSNDSFSSPFQWATKSQRNLRFPQVKREKCYVDEQETHESKPSGSAVEQDQTVKKLNNVEKSIEEKQIKTKIENIKGNKGGSDTTLPVNTRQEDDQPRTSRSGDKDIENKDETSSGKKQNMDSTNNIFEFLQSWNP